ncbi:MAG: hypothetical protein V5A32_03350 [Halovenus sp.]
MTLTIMLATVVSLAVVAGVVVVEFGGSQPVHAENVSCDTGGTSVRCDATLVNENNDTGYNLAVKVIGYDENGDIVTTFTDDATNGGDGIASIPPGVAKNITISTSPAEGVVEGDVRVVDVEPIED